MNTLLLIIVVLLAIVFLVAMALGLAAFCISVWVASGEPDVNGDPERDAGLL